MDERVLEKLEFDQVREMLAAQAYSQAGKELARQLRPLASIAAISGTYNQIEEAMELLRFKDPAFLNYIRPVENPVRKAGMGGILQPSELLNIGMVLKGSRQAVLYLDQKKCPSLAVYKERLHPNPGLEREIEGCIDEDGRLRDDASTELRRVRREIESFRQRIKSYLQDFIRSGNNQSYLQETLVTERQGRYVVPVKTEYRGMVKGIVHDESASGATVFIEPMAVVEMNNRIRSLQIEESREIERILRRLSELAGASAEDIVENLGCLVDLDLLFARANLAYNIQAFRPILSDTGHIDLMKARHPLLGKTAVPINVELGKAFDLLVITGPNTGGKTVVLKTVGLLTIMAMSGLFIPAREGSTIGVFDRVFADIGDEQSLEQSLSTFSSHLSNIINIIKQAGARSLILLDELGAGTDPVEGAALARAILLKIKELGARAVVTTHQSELKNFAYQTARVENACVEFNPITFKPTYSLTIGTPGQSNAFEIARRLGLDEKIVQSARGFVPERERETSDMIRRLKESQYSYDLSREELDRERTLFKQEQEAFLTEKGRFEEEHRRVLASSRKQADEYLRAIKRQADEALDEFKKSLKVEDQKIRWHEIEQGRQVLKRATSSGSAGTVLEGDPVLEIGDWVSITDLKQNGQVIGFPAHGEVEVQVGAMKLRVKKAATIPVPGEKTASRRQYKNLVSSKIKDISMEIDLRGKTADEALYELDAYLDSAVICGLKRVRIIHGKGTGALRKAVREHLKGLYFVTNFQDAAYNEGGFGVTVAELK